MLHDCVFVGGFPVQPQEPGQTWLVVGFAAVQLASATVVPSERWHTTVRSCVPDVLFWHVYWAVCEPPPQPTVHVLQPLCT